MTTGDPFPTALSTLRTTLSTLPTHLSSLRRIASHAPHGPEATSARADLTTALSDAAADAADLRAALDAAAADPARFGLDDAEIARRRGALRKLDAEMAALRRGAAALGASTGDHDGAPPSPGGFELGDDDDAGGDGDGVEAFEMEQQATLLAAQDEQLEGVFETVGSLRLQADAMGRELEEQAGMLDEVDGVADRVGGKLAGGVKKIGWVIRKNEESAGSCCIGVLVVVLVVLLVLLLVL